MWYVNKSRSTASLSTLYYNESDNIKNKETKAYANTKRLYQTLYR